VAAAPTAGITANPVRVLSGQNTRLTWQTSNATSASINGRAVALSGSELRTVSTATDYVLTARGAGGEATSRASVAVFDAPTATISALPAQVAPGATTVVRWSTENATTARVNGRNVALRGSENMTITSPSEFVLVAVGEGGEATAKANVTVYNAPTATISALPAQVAPGATTVVRWSTENATTARVNGRNVALRGSENVTVNVASEFVLVATGAGGEASDKALVNTFAPPPVPVVAAAPRLFLIHFDFDEWAIRDDAMDTMSRIAAFMRQNSGIRMAVVGHTDAMGSDDYNLVLGEERARSVRDYFLAQFGLDASRFALESMGEAAPIAANTLWDGRDNPDGRALNRRAEFIEIR
jgi:outer membrane protein OmpA-like peptidoglycan-associated protein